MKTIKVISENHSRPICYNRNGDPISQDEWSSLVCDKEYKIVRKELINEIMVSTVWLGLDHSFFDILPLIFETMVFCKDIENPYHNYQERYSTIEEAIIGHEQVVNLVNEQKEG